MSWIQAPASQGGSFVSQGRAALPLLVIVAATVVVLSFMLGRQIGSEACALKSDGAAHLLPGTKIAPWWVQLPVTCMVKPAHARRQCVLANI